MGQGSCASNSGVCTDDMSGCDTPKVVHRVVQQRRAASPATGGAQNRPNESSTDKCFGCRVHQVEQMHAILVRRFVISVRKRVTLNEFVEQIRFDQ